MYKDTVTVFNRRGDMWYPTVLRNVDLNVDRASITAKYGSQSNDKAVLHIRYDWQDGNYVIQGKTYLTPKVYAAAEHPAQAITFTSGEFFDFFIEGEWPDAEPVPEDDHGGFFDYLNRTRDGVYVISSVSRFSVIPHFEITGR